MAQLQSLVATDTATNQRILSQLFSDKPGTDPDTLLLLVKLPAKGVLNVTFSLDPTAPGKTNRSCLAEPFLSARTTCLGKMRLGLSHLWSGVGGYGRNFIGNRRVVEVHTEFRCE